MEKVGKKFKLGQLLQLNLDKKKDEEFSQNDNQTSNLSNTKLDSINYELNSTSSRRRKEMSNRFKNYKNENSMKYQNFIEAFDLLQKNLNSTNSTMLNLSEFPSMNANLSREDNIENYLHKPLIKSFQKQGNNLVHIQPQNSRLSINVPYKMNEIFKNCLNKVIELDSEDEDENNSDKKKDKKSVKNLNQNLNQNLKNLNDKNQSIQKEQHNGIIIKNNQDNNQVNNPYIPLSKRIYKNEEEYKEDSIIKVHKKYKSDLLNYPSNTGNQHTNANSNSHLLNKKSTTNDSHKNNTNNEDVQIEPFGLIEDLDEEQNLEMIEYQIKEKLIPNHKKDKDNFYIIDSSTNNNNESKEIKIYQNHQNKKSSEVIDINQVLNNSKLLSISIRTGSSKKIPEKFSFSKKQLFEYSEDKNSQRKYSNNLAKYIQANNHVRNEIENDKINKNLINKFNNCSDNKPIIKSTISSPSAELLNFTSDNDTKKFETPKNLIRFDDFYSPIKNVDFNINVSSFKKTCKTYSQKNILFNSVFSKDNQICITKTSNSLSKKDGNVNLSYSISSQSQNDTVIRPNKIQNENENENESNTFINKDEISEQLDEICEDPNYGQTVYDLDFYNNLLITEKNNPNPNSLKYPTYFKEELTDNFLLENHPDIDSKNLLILFDWLMQITEEFAFKRDTFHYCINYINRYLYFTKNLKKDKLQLLGITCLSIAAKIEEVQIPKLIEYSNATENTYSIENILQMETKILQALHWKIIPITINTWLNWYICQWDLFIDTIEDNKNLILQNFKEDQILYYKKSDDSSYYNLRRITQLVDLISLDYHSLKFNERYIVAALLFVCIILYYKFEYNFEQKKYLGKEKDQFECWQTIFSNFINQSFDLEMSDEELLDTITYCGKFVDFDFTFELPLVYQVDENEIENCNYEDFISYQTYNQKNFDYIRAIYEAIY